MDRVPAVRWIAISPGSETMGHLSLAVVAGCLLLASGRHGTGEQPVVIPGMTRAEVEQIVGEPTFGYQLTGDPVWGTTSALYYTPRLKVVHYRGGKVVRV